MKTTKTYFDGCKWCGATGIVINPIFNPNITGSEWTTICPVIYICDGTKTIKVTEIVTDEIN